MQRVLKRGKDTVNVFPRLEIVQVFPALSKVIHIFPRFQNSSTFLFSRAWSVTDKMWLFCFRFNCFTSKTSIKRIVLPFELLLALELCEYNFTFDMGPSRSKVCSSITPGKQYRKKEIKKTCTYMPQKINIKYITFPLCLKPTTNVSNPNHMRHALAFLLPAQWPWAEICKSCLTKNQSDCRIHCTALSENRKFGIWCMVIVSCICKKGQNPVLPKVCNIEPQHGN